MMPHADLATLPRSPRFLARFVAWLDRARLRSSRYHRTYEELAAHSDRDLADMGFTRADIHTIAKRAADAV